jgi:hypothetical protein
MRKNIAKKYRKNTQKMYRKKYRENMYCEKNTLTFERKKYPTGGGEESLTRGVVRVFKFELFKS